MFNTMKDAGPMPEWWDTTREVMVLGWTSPIFLEIMGYSIVGALIAWRFLKECK